MKNGILIQTAHAWAPETQDEFLRWVRHSPWEAWLEVNTQPSTGVHQAHYQLSREGRELQPVSTNVSQP
jgi:hypothetical protein